MFRRGCGARSPGPGCRESDLAHGDPVFGHILFEGGDIIFPVMHHGGDKYGGGMAFRYGVHQMFRFASSARCDDGYFSLYFPK